MATTTRDEWEARYRDGNMPWDTNHPSTQLRRVIEAGEIAPCRTLELGCGTGTNAVYLAERGFDVTAVDFAEPALSVAEQKASAAGAACRFVRADLLALPDLDGPFDFVFDRGCFHVVRRQGEGAAVRAIAEQVKPGGRLLIMTGNAKEKSEPGPPVLTEAELRGAFVEFFEIEWLRECRFDKVAGDDGEPLAWLAMMRKL